MLQPSLHHFLQVKNDWFIERMRALDYRADPLGVRFGLAYMGGQAILAGELEAFNLRLELLRCIPVSELALKLEEVNQAFAKLTREARLEALERFRKEHKKFSSTLALKAFSRADKARLVQCVALNLSQKLKEWPREFRGLLDLEPFLDGIELYHQAYIYPHLFAKNMKASASNLNSFLPLLIAHQTKPQGQIIQGAHFSGFYSADELLLYFKSVQEAFDSEPLFKAPVVFILSALFHTLALAYLPITKQWVMVNGSALPAEPIQNLELLREKVMAAFSGITPLAVASECYVTTVEQKAAKVCLKRLKQSQVFKKLHQVTALKAKEADCSGSSWLWMAARQGQLTLVKALLKAGAKVQQARIDEVSPLYIAVKYGHEPVIETLMEQGADPSQADLSGISPLLLAGRQHDVEIIRILLGDLTRKQG